MEIDTAAQIAKVRAFGGYAQACCAVLFAILTVMGPMTLAYVLLGPSGAKASLAWQMPAGIAGLVAFTIGFMAIGYLYALFGALSRGEIYTAANVRRIRRVGELVV